MNEETGGDGLQSESSAKLPRLRYHGREEQFLDAVFDLIQYPTVVLKEYIDTYLDQPQTTSELGVWQVVCGVGCRRC